MIRKWMLLTTLAIAGVLLWRYAHRSPTEHFQTERIQQRDILASVTATGTLNALSTVQVGTQVSGTVKAVYVDYNTQVRKGQILALIDPAPFQEQLDEARASLSSAQAAADAAQAQVKEAQIAVQVAEQQSDGQQDLALVSRKAEDLAKLTLDHDQKSEQAGIVSNDTVRTDQTTAALADDDRQVADAQAASAALMISEKQAEVQQSQAQLEAANAQVVQNQAVVADAEVNLQRTAIRSPMDGVVIDRSVSGGETVQASAVVPQLFLIIPATKLLQVDVNLDESNVSQVQVGQNATFTVDAYPGRSFAAKVRQVREQATSLENVVTYDVILDVAPSDARLFLGMTANVAIEVANLKGVAAVPNAALRFRPLSTSAAPRLAFPKGRVYEVGANGAPVLQAVQLGGTDGRYTALLSANLKPGDAVVTSSDMN